MSRKEDLSSFSSEREIARLKGELKKSKGETTRVERLLRAEHEHVRELEAMLSRFTALHPGVTPVPDWISQASRKTTDRTATGLLMLSDLHLDEVVDLDEMSGMNSFNRQIAWRRMQKLGNNVEYVVTKLVSYSWDGLVVALNGDILTGDIHEELARTNEAPTPASIKWWVPKVASLLKHLADVFGKVHVVCTDGNHDRSYKKIPAKKRAESSFAWIFYNWLADVCDSDERITFAISTAPSQVFSIYGHTFHQVHGDGFRSAGGVGGIYPSMLKYIARMDQMWAAQGRVIDTHLFGHWHQYKVDERFIVNGSLKGYDEYARSGGFGFEPPRQAFIAVTPSRGVDLPKAIYCE